MANTHDKLIKRLNTSLPDPLARYVGEVTGKGSLYETPSEFIRDLVRRHMEKSLEQEHQLSQARRICRRTEICRSGGDEYPLCRDKATCLPC